VEAKAHGVNIAGFMIGNGCPGWDVVTCTPYSCGGGPGKAPVVSAGSI